MSGGISFTASDFGDFVFADGLAGPDQQAPGSGRWTNGAAARLAFVLPSYAFDDVIILLDIIPFIRKGTINEQVVNVRVNDTGVASWTLVDPLPRRRVIFVERRLVPASNVIELDFEIPNCTAPANLGLNDDKRALGLKFQRLAWESRKARPSADDLLWQYGRPVGIEARKTFDQKIETGFWSRFVTGPHVLDIGYKGRMDARDVVPILEGATGVDLDYPGYDGRTLPFGDDTQDAVYSSHCLEHIPDYIKAIQEWHRVIEPGGHIITVVPSSYLYERRRRPPSRHNGAHVRFYTPASLLAEFEAALEPNSYRVRHLRENDQGYRYELGAEMHPAGCYEIELVIEKTAPPKWKLPD
jgi:SAM-dependent methyltransferase